MAAPLALDPRFAADLVANLGAARAAPAKGTAATARAQSQDFEAVFLNSMFQHMFAGLDGDGPMGNTPGTGVWRSFLTEQYAKSFAKSGGIGLADPVYRALLAQQEAKSAKSP